MAETTTLSWSDIPPELARLVLRRLPAHVDRVRFAAVCPQWRVAAGQAALPPPLPLLAISDGTLYSLPESKRFHFPGWAGFKYACGNWLVFSREDECFLWDPFSNATMTLPALSRVRVRFADNEIDESLDEKDLTVHDVLVCSPHLIAGLVRFRFSSQIAVCQPGAASWWSVQLDEGYPWSPYLAGIAVHQERLYAFDNGMGNLLAVDISFDNSTGDPWVSRAQKVINGFHDPESDPVLWWTHYYFFLQKYLVVSSGGLLMVKRKSYRKRLNSGHGPVAAELSKFEVFKADLEQAQWTRVTTIGNDQLMFPPQYRPSSSSSSSFICASDHDMLGDRIVFLEDDGDVSGYNNEGSASYCVYDMRDGKFSTPLPRVSWNPALKATWLFPQG
ncbi:hypothetical protein ACP70R_007420 [Stipagrostis hirtigluma subsp. patula]